MDKPTKHVTDDGLETISVVGIDSEGRSPRQDVVAREEPLELRIDAVPIAVLMRTPGHDTDLACGFVVTEGIAQARDIRFAAHCRRTAPELVGNVVNVHLKAGVKVDFERLRRNTFSGSSCGICGKATIDAITVRTPAPKPLTEPLAHGTVAAAMQAMRSEQRLFEATGGIHAAALCNLSTGRTSTIREDIGRHNAVDKVIGNRVLAKRLPLSDHLLVVSGRTSFEVVQKAIVAGVPAIAGVSAPSSLAVRLAERAGVVLIGFARGDSLNVYSCHERVS